MSSTPLKAPQPDSGAPSDSRADRTTAAAQAQLASLTCRE